MRALQNLECESALSAGVNMMFDPDFMRGNAIAGFTSPNGRSHTFDKRADGYARGEAISVIACRLGESADADAQMLGSAIRQDGRSASLTAPSGQAQRKVLTASLADANHTAENVRVLEAHGTGTALGDPIEANAVSVVFQATDPLVIGSLKANAGHTEPGAGLSGALKLLVQLAFEVMSPNAQLRAINGHVGASLRVLTSRVLPCQVGVLPTDGLRAVGGVSSFGYSGTIAHTTVDHKGGAAGRLALPQQLVYKPSTFKWIDAQHPFAQRHLPASDGAQVFRSPAAGAMHALVADHVVRGRVIFPGAGYLELARAAAFAEAALQGVLFLQPLMVETPGLVVECAVRNGNRFEVRSGEDGSWSDSQLHCSGVLTNDRGGHRPDHAPARSQCAHSAAVGALYDGFDVSGLQYGPGYRTLVQAWVWDGSVAARLRTRRGNEGTSVHPADLDDALCVSALASSGEGDEGGTQLPFAVDDVWLHRAASTLWAVRCFTTAP